MNRRDIIRGICFDLPVSEFWREETEDGRKIVSTILSDTGNVSDGFKVSFEAVHTSDWEAEAMLDMTVYVMDNDGNVSSSYHRIFKDSIAQIMLVRFGLIEDKKFINLKPVMRPIVNKNGIENIPYKFLGNK